MVKWRGRERSSNIEDRRGQGGLGGLGGLGSSPFGRGGGIRIPTGRAGGGIGGLIGVVIILGIIWFATGQNPLDMLTGGSSTPTTSSSSSAFPGQDASQDDLANFVSVMVRDNEKFWGEVFQQNGQSYKPPKVVLFTSQTQSGCGVADVRSGPFYCPPDETIYIDLSFYEMLRQQFGAAGDFAQAYVIAHEVGHHVQQLTGVLPAFNARRGTMSPDEANAYSVRVELQADCYAGVWANYMNQEQFLEQGDADEAINAANRIGDDTLTRGQVSPREFTHGTSAQRMEWLRRGMQTGDVGQCNTLSGQI